VIAERVTTAPWPEHIAIIGAGTIGLGIAEQFALAGRRVLITDATPELARQAKRTLSRGVRARRGGAAAGGRPGATGRCGDAG